ncbi:MAG: LD-carboxypeptidase [Cyanophyceae cyanobacterium]
MIARRHFLYGAAAITASVASASATSTSVLKPAKLQPGAGIGLISPAGATFIEEELDIVLDAVQALGLVPYLAPHLLDRYGYFAGKDRDRAADINQFFADPQIDALLPIRGGWGCSRILPYLNYDTIRQNPKIVVGFSDLTALLLAIYAQTGLITFHGPNGLTSWRPAQTESFRRVLFAGNQVSYENQLDSSDADRLMQVKYRVRTLRPGRARGKLMGGNLSVLSALVGTPYFPDTRGAILFIEDVGESIYRVDRMLTHLKLAGVLDGLAGFVFGQCIDCLPEADYGSLTLEEVLQDHIQPLGVPAWSGAQIGHLEPILTIPIGIEAVIDADIGKIDMLEPGVV